MVWSSFQSSPCFPHSWEISLRSGCLSLRSVRSDLCLKYLFRQRNCGTAASGTPSLRAAGRRPWPPQPPARWGVGPAEEREARPTARAPSPGRPGPAEERDARPPATGWGGASGGRAEERRRPPSPEPAALWAAGPEDRRGPAAELQLGGCWLLAWTARGQRCWVLWGVASARGLGTSRWLVRSGGAASPCAGPRQ